eukprot:gene12328-14459_t
MHHTGSGEQTEQPRGSGAWRFHRQAQATQNEEQRNIFQIIGPSLFGPGDLR